MAGRRCENCKQWSSTDQVWGECTISGKYRSEQRMHATYYDGPGDVRDATLETRADFGCVEWGSLASVLKRIEKQTNA